MLQKILITFFTFAFLTTHVFAGHEADFKSLVDELNYSLTVEWDQKDKEFYNAQVEKFNKGVNELKAKGLTISEMFKVVGASIQDKALVKDLESLHTQISLKLISDTQALAMLKELQKRGSVRGSSWAPDIMWYEYAMIGFVIAAVATMITICVRQGDGCSGSSGGGGGGSTQTCYDETTCTSWYSQIYGWVEECTTQTKCY